MKNAVLCAIMSIACLSFSFAQKVDLDKYSFSCAGMYKLPSEPLAEDFKTFNVTAKTSGSLSSSEISDKVDINGWKHVPSTEKAHITIELTLGNLIIDKTEITERKEEQKDKAGKVTGVKMFYRATMQYSMPVSHAVKDYTGKSYKSGVFNFNQTGSHSSDEYSSYSPASNYISMNRESLKERFANELSNKFISSINSNLTSKWGLTLVKSTSDHFWLMDSKKHPEQDSMQMMAKLMKEKFNEFREGTLVTEFQEMMAPFIGYLERLPARYKTDEKNDKKLRYSAYYNLAKLYWYMDDPATADKYADLLIKNDYDPKDGEGLKKDNASLKAVFEKAKINKRHLTFDASSFVGPK